MSAAAGPNIIEKGLVLCLDAGNKKSYSGSGNVWRDLAGSNNGTLTNGPTFSNANAGNINFDGTNDYVSLGSETLISTTAPFTAYLWMNHNPRTSGELFHRMITLKSSATEPLGIAFVNGTSAGYSGLYLTSASGWVKGSNGYFPTVNMWGLLTVTYNGTGSTNGSNFQIYWNSVNIGFTANPSAGAASLPNASFLGGRRVTTDTQLYKGQIANFLLYNREHNNNLIIQNYNATKGRFKLT
jgi:hypothetical protein